MKIFAETDRIILRELVSDDAPGMFIMDSNPEVHKYLQKQPIQTIGEAEDQIQYIRLQYKDFGIGRWAIVEKSTGQFVGWGGLKFRTDEVNGHTNFYDVGYRLMETAWGKGYATESAKLSVRYAFEELKLDAVYALAHVENVASRKALIKAGLKITAQVIHEGITCDWFEVKRDEFLQESSAS